MSNWLEKMTGRLPFWITFWPIQIQKRNGINTFYDAKRLLNRCNIHVRGVALIWLTFSFVWLYVPRRQAYRAEATLKKYGFRIMGRNLTP